MNLQYLKGVGEKRARLFLKLGVDSVDALLRYYPRAYADFKNVTEIFASPLGETACIKAEIVTAIEERTHRSGMQTFRFVAADESGQMTVTLFNQKYLAGKLHTGSTYLFYGKMGGNPFYREMSSPEIHEENYAAIHPIYSACEGLPSSAIEKVVKTALSHIPDEFLPEYIIEKYKLCPLEYALKNIHFPASDEALSHARRRLMFEELFLLQCGLAKERVHNTGKGILIPRDYTDEFISRLPFSPTGAQRRVIKECIGDMQSGKRCNRLIQGDVGSGKTAVCAALMYTAAKNGYQSALMAPTEILAEQHYKTLCNFFGDSLRVALLTGSATKKQKDTVKQQLSNGAIDIIVGTHALIVDNVVFKNLALVITDEQHRFGVAQRQKLSEKGERPHTIVMSATPIPRTLALIIYGDLDISIIDELPAGRSPVKSYAVSSAFHSRIYDFIKREIDSGRQGYIICPLVEESESPLQSAEDYYEKLSRGVFKDYKLGLLHGKMSASAKEKVMAEFSRGEISLLIATTVVEVGVDVPNATVLVIENAERFGLSQLHQLRGRVGRGKYPASCILISDDNGEKTVNRLKTLCSTTDGFKIADADLLARGPGDFIGRRQHGLPELRIADMQTDINAMRIAGEEARALLTRDPELSGEPLLKREVDLLFSVVSRL